MTRCLPVFSLLALVACPPAGDGGDDPVDPTDDIDSTDPVEVVAELDERLSFVYSGVDASDLNLFQIIAADTEPQPSIVAFEIEKNRPEGIAAVCSVSGRTVSAACPVIPIGHHNATLPAHGDVDGDGRDDILVLSKGRSDGEGFVSVLPVSASGIGEPIHSELPFINPALFTTGDLDGDGNIDLVVSSEDEPRLAVLAGTGSGSFAEAVFIELGDAQGADLLFADIDKDGQDDLIGVVKPADTTTQMWVWTGGSLSPGEPTKQTIWAPLGVGFADGADLDEDGHFDFVSFGLGPAFIHYGTEAGFEARAYGVEGTLVTLSQIVDFDGDGHLDIAGTTGSAVGVSVFFGDGDRGFPGFQDLMLDQRLRRDAFIADFDGDGKLDVASTGYNFDTGDTLQIAFQE